MHHSALHSAINSALHSGMRGSPMFGGIAPTFSAITPNADGTISIEPTKGTGSATFTRATTAYVRDWENVYRQVNSGEARIQGARRVENLCLASDDISNVTYWPGGGASATADTLTATASYAYRRQLFTVIPGEQYTFSFRAYSNDITSVNLRAYDNTNLADINNTFATISTTSSRLSVTITIPAGCVSAYFYLAFNATVGQSVTFTNIQLENISGQSNTAPGEYIPTTTAAAHKYYWKTNGNTVASNVVTEATGVPLRSTVQKNGATVFANYQTRANSTAYALNDRMIPATGSGPNGGNGYWYYVSAITTGTSGGSAPTYPTTIGASVVDGGITLTCGGYYTVAGYLGEPAATNSLLQSRDFSTTWIGTADSLGSAGKNQTGIDGVANAAWTLDDNDAGTFITNSQSVTIPNDSNTHCASIYILKDTDTTRYPEFQLSLDGGTQQRNSVQINTQTGASTVRTSTGTVTETVEDHGDWWRLILTVANNTTGNVSATITIWPAVTTTFGITEITATGTVVVDQAQLELNTSTPSSPIPTTTAAVTRNADVLSVAASGNLSDTAGTVFCSVRADDWANQAAADSIVGTDSTESLLRYSTNPAMEAFDGTNTVDGATDANITGSYQVPAYARWTGSTLQVGNNGASGTAGSYDGSWGATSITVLGGVQGCITDIRIYNTDLGQTKCEAATAYD